MTLSLMTPDEILSLKLDKEDTRSMLVGNELYGALATTMPYVAEAFWVFLLFRNYTEHYTQIFCRVYIFSQVFFRAVPLALAHSASANAQFQFGQQFGNISQIEISHYLLVCILYQAIIWLAICLSLLVDFIEARRSGIKFGGSADDSSLLRGIALVLLHTEAEDVDKITRWLLLKFSTEPLIEALTRGSQVFIIAEGKAEYAAGMSLYHTTIETICVFTAFLKTKSADPTRVFESIAMAEFVSGLCFSVIYAFVLLFQGHRFIFFQLSRKYMFPVNWATIRRICLTAVPMLMEHGGLYLGLMVELTFLKFYSDIQADTELSNLLFSITIFDIYQSLVEGVITAFSTHHAYYYGKQKYVKARTAVNSTLFVLTALAIVVVVLIAVSKVTIYDIFTNGSQYNQKSDLLGQNLSYMGLFYVSTFFYVFGSLARYLCQYRNSLLLSIVTLLSYIPYTIIVVRQYLFYPYSTDYSVQYYFIIVVLSVPCIVVFIFYTVRDFYLIQKYGDYDKYTPFNNN